MDSISVSVDTELAVGHRLLSSVVFATLWCIVHTCWPLGRSLLTPLFRLVVPCRTATWRLSLVVHGQLWYYAVCNLKPGTLYCAKYGRVSCSFVYIVYIYLLSFRYTRPCMSSMLCVRNIDYNFSKS